MKTVIKIIFEITDKMNENKETVNVILYPCSITKTITQ